MRSQLCLVACVKLHFNESLRRIIFWSKTCMNVKDFLPEVWFTISQHESVGKDKHYITFCKSCEEPLWSSALQKAVGYSHLKLQTTLLQLHFRDVQHDTVIMSSSHQVSKLHYSFLFLLVHCFRTILCHLICMLIIGLQILLWGNLASLDEEQSAEKSSALAEDESEFLRWWNQSLLLQEETHKSLACLFFVGLFPNRRPTDVHCYVLLHSRSRCGIDIVI